MVYKDSDIRKFSCILFEAEIWGLIEPNLSFALIVNRNSALFIQTEGSLNLTRLFALFVDRNLALFI